ncbi:ribonuclease H-like domain-containing protein [Tanacetum coccineum]
MNPQETLQVDAPDEKWVSSAERVKISSTNIRLETTVTQKEETFQVVIDIIKNSTCFKAFTISADVLEIFMQQFWYTIKKVPDTNSYEFLLANKKCIVNAEVFRTILDICPRVEGVDFVDVLGSLGSRLSEIPTGVPGTVEGGGVGLRAWLMDVIGVSLWAGLGVLRLWAFGAGYGVGNKSGGSHWRKCDRVGLNWDSRAGRGAKSLARGGGGGGRGGVACWLIAAQINADRSRMIAARESPCYSCKDLMIDSVLESVLDIIKEKVILEWGDEQDREHSDNDDDVEKDEKDDDAYNEGDDHVSDTQDADDEDVETESDEDDIYKYKIRVRKDEDAEMKDVKVEESDKRDSAVSWRLGVPRVGLHIAASSQVRDMFTMGYTWGHKATKDETSGILKSFITRVENPIDQRVMVIRCDNGTEFKNKEMNQFCERKGIKREFSVAKTPQQNEVAERKNKTLIEAARTMLADSKLPTTFWAEAVNTTCYVQNRSINSKAFRVFNSRTRIVEENLHVQFSKARMETVPGKDYILLPLWTSDPPFSQSLKM